MAGTVTVVEASEENIAQIDTQPTPDTVPPAPTPAPEVPPAPVNLIEPPAPGDVVVGVMAFRDTLAPSDTAVVALNSITPAPAGSELHAWLISNDNRALDIGLITPDESGNVSHIYTDPTQQNLMALYDGFEITQEPEFDDDPTPGTVVYSGRQAGEATSFIRTITVRADNTPGNYSLAVGARLQTEELIRHVEYVQLAFELGSIADAQRHTEHILNILDGQGADHDSAHGVQNPGDGFGLLPYIAAIQDAAVQAANTGDATEAIIYHAEHVRLSTDNAEQWATTIRDAGLQIITAQRIGDIGPQIETFNRFSQLLLSGEDTDGSGEVDPIEGGIFTAYQHAQYMGAVGVIAGDSLAVVAAEPILEPGLDEQAAAGGVLVEMADFEFVPNSITIPPGTTVRFVNIGQDKHSATADNDLFNSALLDNGQEFTFAFPDAGTYSYFCLLHGTPGGNGMAGTIVIEP
jgi:plastocyanin